MSSKLIQSTSVIDWKKRSANEQEVCCWLEPSMLLLFFFFFNQPFL